MKKFLCIIRWFLAAGCTTGAALIIHRASNSHNLGEAAAFAMVGIGVLVASAFLIIPETATPIAEFLGDCWGGIFFPSARFNKPPLSYLLADFYSTHGRHEEAIHEYLKILRYYPNERRAYLGVISLCNTIGATEVAAKYERRFRKRFRISKSRRRPGS